MNKLDILNAMNEKISGHLTAKKELINLVERIKVRNFQRNMLGMSEDCPSMVKLKNLLLVGKSGTGKTFLVETIAEICKLPLLGLDATSLTLTAAGGGVKLQDILDKIEHLSKTFFEENQSKYLSQKDVIDQMVIFIDEFDKLGELGAGGGGSEQGWYRRVQSNFLRLFENKVPGYKNLTFIFAGAFMLSDIYKEENPIKKQNIGFFVSDTSESDLKKEPEDIEECIIKSGIMPELVGRIHSIISLDSLTRGDFRKILLEKVLPEKNMQLDFMDCGQLELKESEIERIVEESFKSKQGVRLLYKRVDELAVDLEFQTENYELLTI